MKSLLTTLFLSLTLFTFSQSIALKNAYILEVDESTRDIIHQGKTKSDIIFMIGDSTVHHTETMRKTEELVKDISYKIVKREMIKKVHNITMEADGTTYYLLIPKNRRKKVALSSNNVTKVISGWTRKLD